MKLHNFCNIDARDTLAAHHSDSPNCDDAHSDLTRSRPYAVAVLASRSRPGFSTNVSSSRQPQSRNLGGGDRAAPSVHNRVYTHAPKGWKQLHATAFGNMDTIRNQCVSTF